MEEQRKGTISVAGVEEAGTSATHRGGRALSLLLVGMAVGLALGITFTARPSVPTTTTVATVEEAPPATTTTPPAEEARLARRVPGWSDALVVAAAESGGSTGTAVWEATAAHPTPRALPLGEMAADAEHRWIASVTDGRYAPGGSLWVGDETYMEPVATEVSSAVWHADEAGRLAWIQSDGAHTPSTLFVTRFFPGQQARPAAVAELDPRAEVVWWTGAGVAVLEGERLLLLTEEGDAASSLEGVDRFVAGGRAAAAAVVGGEAVLLTPDLSAVTPAPWDPDCPSGAFAPAANPPLAILCDGELVVWAVPDGGDPFPTESLSRPGILPPQWDPGGRFVVVPSIDPLRQHTSLTFLDRVEGVTHEVSYPGRILSMVTVRSS